MIDTTTDELLNPVSWDNMDIEWSGRGWDRGLRGIAFYDNDVFIAASDEIFRFNQRFQIEKSYRNPYLKHCHEISVFGDHLFVSSTGYDSVLGLNLKTEEWILGTEHFV